MWEGLGRVNPEAGGGERKRTAVKNSSDVSDVIDAEQCIMNIMRGSGGYLDSLSTRGGSSC